MEDPDDLEQSQAMIDPLPPSGCHDSNCQRVPGIQNLLGNLQVCLLCAICIVMLRNSCLQTFSMFWRVQYRERAGDRLLNRGLNATCERMFASMWQRLGRLSPTLCISGIQLNLVVPEDDEIHVSIAGTHELCSYI